LLIRTVAVIAGVSAAGKLWALVNVARAGEMGTVIASGVFGWLTMAAWAVALATGPLALVYLWKFRESGRLAAIVFFGYGLAYYAAGLVVLGDADTGAAAVLVAVASFAAPLAVLLLPSTRRVCAARA
jgi:hypothetical protein